MFILFRCSAGGNHGWGNIKRLELIYNALKNKYRFNYKFIVDANLEVKKYLTVKKINFESVTQINENNILNKIGPVDFSILELLHCSIKIQKKYNQVNKIEPKTISKAIDNIKFVNNKENENEEDLSDDILEKLELGNSNSKSNIKK